MELKFIFRLHKMSVHGLFMLTIANVNDQRLYIILFVLLFRAWLLLWHPCVINAMENLSNKLNLRRL